MGKLETRPHGGQDTGLTFTGDRNLLHGGQDTGLTEERVLERVLGQVKNSPPRGEEN